MGFTLISFMQLLAWGVGGPLLFAGFVLVSLTVRRRLARMLRIHPEDPLAMFTSTAAFVLLTDVSALGLSLLYI
jgi:hypothetical protein